MAIKNGDLGGTDWLSGELLKAVDLNDTFDAAVADYTTDIAAEATTRAEEDGFTYIDSTPISTSSTSDVIVRTYLINKAIDGLLLFVNIGNSSGTASMSFYKNTTEINESKVSDCGGEQGGLTTNKYNRSSSPYYLVTTSVVPNSAGYAILYLNESFNVNDTFVLKMKASAGTSQSNRRIIQGIKNKSTDTTWVSVS